MQAQRPEHRASVREERERPRLHQRLEIYREFDVADVPRHRHRRGRPQWQVPRELGKVHFPFASPFLFSFCFSRVVRSCVFRAFVFRAVGFRSCVFCAFVFVFVIVSSDEGVRFEVEAGEEVDAGGVQQPPRRERAALEARRVVVEVVDDHVQELVRQRRDMWPRELAICGVVGGVEAFSGFSGFGAPVRWSQRVWPFAGTTTGTHACAHAHGHDARGHTIRAARRPGQSSLTYR